MGLSAQAIERRDRRNRRKRAVRPATEALNRITYSDREKIVAETDYPDGVQRPRTRGECQGGPRPCPFVSCFFHLYLDVKPRTGNLVLNFPDLEVWEMKESCALDVADRFGATLEEVGEIYNVTRERIRQVQFQAFAKIEAERDPGLLEYVQPGPVRRRRLPVIEGEAYYEDDEETETETDGDWDDAVADGWE